MAAHGRSLDEHAVSITLLDGGLGRCARFEVVVRHHVPVIRVPWLTGLGTHVVTSTHSEIVDPYRSGIAGAAHCAI